MKTYQLKIEDKEMIVLKVESAKRSLSIKKFLLDSAKEKIEREENQRQLNDKID